MTRALPPLTWFRSFEAAARHLNFTAAASEIGLTQSAVSQQVRALEDRLGVVLFQRLPRGLAMTDDGRKLLPQVEAALNGLAAATDHFSTGSTRNLLTVATSVSVAQFVIQPHLARFLQAHPGTQLRLLSTIWPDDTRMSHVDIEIRFGSEKQVGTGAERLLPDGLIAVSRAGRESDLDDQPLIEAVGTSEGWRHWSKSHRRPIAQEPQIYVDSYGMALDLALQGAGVALTSSLLAARPLRAGLIKLIGPATLPSTEGYFLAVNGTTEMAEPFARWLKTLLPPVSYQTLPAPGV